MCGIYLRGKNPKFIIEDIVRKKNEMSENNSPTNEELHQLIQQIQELEPQSSERCKLLNDLVKMIQPELIEKSRKVVTVTRKDDFLVEDALQNTYINLQKYICTYQPKSEVMTWVTNIYKNEFYKLSEKCRKVGIKWAPSKDKNNTSGRQNNLHVIRSRVKIT